MNDEERRRELDAIPGSDPGDIEAEQAKMMIAINKDKARLRRLRILTPLLWGLFVVGFVVGSALSTTLKLEQGSLMESMIGVVLVLILIVAVVCTVSLYVRRQSLVQRQLMTSLAGIEKTLLELGSKLR